MLSKYSQVGGVRGDKGEEGFRVNILEAIYDCFL